MARIVYIGDRRTGRVNWGCRATSEAMYQLLSQRFEIIGTSSNRDFSSVGIFDTLLPHKAATALLGARKRGRPISTMAYLYLRLERRHGAKFGYLAEDPALSLKYFLQEKARDPFLQSVYELIAACDAVVFNSEGSLILTTPPGSAGLIDLMLIELAAHLERPIFYVNGMITDSPLQRRNEMYFQRVLKSLAKCTAVSWRDRESLRIVQGASTELDCSFIPDALFTFCKYYEIPEATLPPHADFIIPFPADRQYWGTLDFSKPYVCVGGSSLGISDEDRTTHSFVQLTQGVKTLGLNVILVPTCENDRFLLRVADATCTPIVPLNLPVLTGGAILANARLYISGRFHPSILASLGGTPCVFLQSNSHKTRSLQEVLEYDEIREFPLWLSDEDIQSVLHLCRTHLEEGQALRDRIRGTVRKRAEQANRLCDFIEEGLRL